MIDVRAIAPDLRLGTDGIWHAQTLEDVSFPDHAHDINLSVEDVSFWFRHRNACILSLIRTFPPPGRGPVFDIGGGNGFVARAIAASGMDVVLVEPGLEGARNAKARGISTVVCGTLETARFRSRSLAAVGLFDVIEHIDDDTSFLKTLHDHLLDGGMAYATVPAYQWLWSDEDETAGHFRRYTTDSLSARFSAAGFQVKFATYIFRPMPLPILLFRSLPSALGIRRGDTARAVREHGSDDGATRRMIDRVLAPEVSRITSRRAIRFGGSCLIAAERRG
jgi:SAM-dependent methyltransferase